VHTLCSSLPPSVVIIVEPVGGVVVQEVDVAFCCWLPLLVHRCGVVLPSTITLYWQKTSVTDQAKRSSTATSLSLRPDQYPCHW